MAVAALTLAVESETLLGRLAFAAAESSAYVINSTPYIAGVGFAGYGLSKIKLHEKANFSYRGMIPPATPKGTNKRPITAPTISPNKRPRRSPTWLITRAQPSADGRRRRSRYRRRGSKGRFSR